MFTGIVEQMGSVVRLMRRGGGARLEIRAPEAASEVSLGDSIAVNGSCVTVVETNGHAFACDLVPETVARTNLGILQVGEEVNLELPMRASDRFGGHIVQGHVDCVGTVRSRRRAGAQEMLEVNVPFELTRYIALQGSVAIDGVSLTVVGVDKDRFRVALIPHTVAVTTLGQKGQGSSVNVEVDVLSKYVERHMQARQSRPGVLLEDRIDKPAERAGAEAEQPSPPKAKAAVKKASAKPAAPKKRPVRSAVRATSARAASPKPKRPARRLKPATKRRR